MKKILILGATGMAGHVMYYYLLSLQKYELYTVCFRNKLNDDSIVLDVHDTKGLTTALTEICPDVVINCIGILIKGAQESIENAVYINAFFPHLLERLMKETIPFSKMIHISTDCVFSGKKGAYTDSDEKDALDVYGMSKNLGEVASDRSLTIRTSIIGPELKNGEGLFHWIFLQSEKGQLQGYEKSIWGGVTTLELAKSVDAFIDNKMTGLFQLSNNQKITKYELIHLIVEQFKLDIQIHKADGIISDKSIVSSEREGFSYTVPDYSSMIREMHDFMQTNMELYNFYLRDVCKKH
jgi:dTDP-4-dehydrorhamnose reductase